MPDAPPGSPNVEASVAAVKRSGVATAACWTTFTRCARSGTSKRPSGHCWLSTSQVTERDRHEQAAWQVVDVVTPVRCWSCSCRSSGGKWRCSTRSCGRRGPCWRDGGIAGRRSKRCVGMAACSVCAASSRPAPGTSDGYGSRRGRTGSRRPEADTACRSGDCPEPPSSILGALGLSAPAVSALIGRSSRQRRRSRCGTPTISSWSRLAPASLGTRRSSSCCATTERASPPSLRAARRRRAGRASCRGWSDEGGVAGGVGHGVPAVTRTHAPGRLPA
jgi:hypothetical protein